MACEDTRALNVMKEWDHALGLIVRDELECIKEIAALFFGPFKLALVQSTHVSGT
jgi:hypothetical protein